MGSFPGPELLRRRAAGEPLRELASDYGVPHTTLGRYFARPRSSEQEVRRKAKEQAATEQEQSRRVRAAFAARTPRRPLSDYEAWLDERDAPRQPLTRADRLSQNDQTAARIVAKGGGIQAVIAATELRTLENVAHLIDPAILTQAFDNDRTAWPRRACATRLTMTLSSGMSAEQQLIRAVQGLGRGGQKLSPKASSKFRQ